MPVKRGRTKRSSGIPEWLVMGDGCAKCLRCGKMERPELPMLIAAFKPWVLYVGAKHQYCKEGDAPPRSDLSGLPLNERAEAWISGDDTGSSSKVIWRHMRNLPQLPGFDSPKHNWPRDPADLGRCLRLLALIPEWLPRIGEVAVYGSHWKAIIGNWEELTSLYQEEVPEHRGSAPKLYARMQDLTQEQIA